MINLEAQYFNNVNKNLLLAVGLRPYRQTLFARIQYIFYFVFLTSAIVFQLSTFLTTECTLRLTTEVLSFTFVYVIGEIKYSTFRMNSETIKFTMEQFQRICDDIKDKKELAIIEKYSAKGKRITIGLVVSICSGMTVCQFAQLWPSILDVALPKNESRPRRLWFPGEYFVDQQRYFYLILFHCNAAVFIANVAVLAVMTFFISSKEYICGMLTIASYRIENSMKMDKSQYIGSSSENHILERLSTAVEIHCKAIKIFELVLARFEVMFTMLLMIGVIAMTLNLFRLFQIISFEFNLEDLLLTVMYIAYVYSHNNKIFITAYNIQWYKAPIHVQRLILFLLQKGTKDFVVKIVGGLFTASLQCFTVVTDASMSYFTFLYALQV